MSAGLALYVADWQFRQSVSDRLGAAGLGTTDTTGFLLVPSCAGTPTGVPANVPAGMVPMVVDSTNNRLYFYSGGAWRNAGP